MQSKISNVEKISMGLLAIVFVVIVFNAYQINQLKSITTLSIDALDTLPTDKENTGSATLRLGSAADVIPKGTPKIYGNELGVSFDDVSATNPQKADATIRKLGVLDQQISLSGKDLERYIAIASQISCEYCCGAESIIFSNGKAACGCAHSFAMRGLAKYLIKNHGNEYTNDEILEEMGKWKTLFFPTVMAQKAKILQEKSIEMNYINLASNKYRGIEKGASGGGMVGGC